MSTNSLGYDTLALARELIGSIGSVDATHGYDALARLAPMLSCWQYGHPKQPKHLLGRFEQRPWRCSRCGTWWVTVPHFHPEGVAMLWERVEEGA